MMFKGRLPALLCLLPAVVVSQEAFTDTNIRTAVGKWIEDPDAAFITYGSHIKDWNTSQVTNMNALFKGRTLFNDDISAWNISKVTNMYQMFFQANNFDQPLSEWDVSTVIQMRQMFFAATVFNQDLSKWDVVNVNDMYAMFEEATSLNQDFCSWGDKLPYGVDVGNMFLDSSCPTYSNPVLTNDPAGPFCHACPDFPQWQIKKPAFIDGAGVNSLHFAHGVGDNATATQVKIYGFNVSSTSADITDSCYSNGGTILGTLGADEITGLVISEYEHTVSAGETSFNFTFGTDIQENAFIYSSTGVDDSGTKVATIRFCVMMELLSRNTTDATQVVVVNYAEFAFGYDATLNGTIVLADAFQVQPADPTSGGIADDTFAVETSVCGPQGGTLNQGDSFHICIDSTSYPEASISGITSLTYTAPFGDSSGSVVLDAIIGGNSADVLTKFVALDDCDGSLCIVKTQLQGNFYPPNGFMNVSITGKATMDLGGRRVLAKVVPGDRCLQEETTSKSGFSIDVETAALLDTPAGTTKKGVATSIILTTFAAASLRFF